MATHGSVSAYDPSVEDWTTYTQRLHHYFVANDVETEVKKRSILLSACGAATYKLIRNLIAEDKLESTPYEDIVKLVKAHYDPTPSAIMQRYKFNSRTRAEGESVSAYVTALRDIAQNCDYKDSLRDMLRDKLVHGVRHERITNRLLAEKTLTYEKALELALVIESAERDTKQLQATQATPQVHHSAPARRGRGQNRRPPRQGTQFTCYRCGGGHAPEQCRFKNTVCHGCKRRGHLIRVCRSTPSGSAARKTHGKRAHYLQEEQEESASGESASEQQNDDHGPYSLFTIRDVANQPMLESVTINGVPVVMEMDTGAAFSVITQTTYQKIAQQNKMNDLEPSDLKLRSYTGETIQVFGQVPVVVNFGHKQSELYIHVVEGEGPDLMGRDWMSVLKVTLNTGKCHSVQENRALKEVLEKHAEVFGEGLGCLKGTESKLNIDPQATPKFFKARSVPLALKPKVEAELDNLEAMGIISPVKFSHWAAPVVPVLKQNGKVRLCGDFKVTINQACQGDSYPLPRVDELLANLSGGRYFSKLDMSQAYLQLPLDEPSKELVTINTHKGLYRFNRLPFGVSCAPSVFQRTMDNLFQGVKGVSVYIDDILITGATVEEHLQTLNIVLQILETAGLKLNQTKCFFLHSQVEYLGHIIDKDGLHPTAEKVRAIQEAPRPKNIGELKSFFGLINYYNRFLPNLSTKLAPLYRLLKKDVKWMWGKEEDDAFLAAKNALQDNSLLAHYDESKQLLLACDASQYGLGAVLSHVMEDGQERPIAYASRTLTVAEKNYSQLEKEGLAIIFGVKKFHNYLFGRPFIIESDHQPLSFLFKETKGISQTASSRIQRWALTLSAYKYSIRHKSGVTLSNADALSRLPRPVTTRSDRQPADLLHLINHLSGTPVQAAVIKDLTNKDPVLSQVRKFVLSGWPEETPPEFKPFRTKSLELSTIDGCLLWGNRVVIPPQAQEAILSELHETHPGTSKMKALARSYVWWPKMDEQIEELVKKCPECQKSQSAPPPAPLHPWQWPDQPWSRVHLDFAGPFMGHMFLVIVDAYSKWLDAHIMPSITSTKTIEVLRSVFATHGLPQTIVTDNGPSFVSQEFSNFMSQNGIKHIKSAPYHPSTNGQAERSVQTLKKGLKRVKGATVQERLSRFLFDYRITPHTVTGVAPSELLMKRRLRSRFDSLFPDIRERVEKRQKKQKEMHDNRKVLRKFKKDDSVFVESFSRNKPRWIPGIVVQVSGSLSYQVKLEDGTVVKRHVDHVRSRYDQPTAEVRQPKWIEVSLGPTMPEEESTTDETPTLVTGTSRTTGEDNPTESSGETETEPVVQPPRRSTRVRHPPDRFET